MCLILLWIHGYVDWPKLNTNSTSLLSTSPFYTDQGSRPTWATYGWALLRLGRYVGGTPYPEKSVNSHDTQNGVWIGFWTWKWWCWIFLIVHKRIQHIWNASSFWSHALLGHRNSFRRKTKNKLVSFSLCFGLFFIFHFLVSSKSRC